MKYCRLLLWLLIPNFALADVVIPFFFGFAWMQIVFLGLVVLVESIYLFKKLPHLTEKKIFKGTLLANLFSTFIGNLVLFCIRLPFQKWTSSYCGKLTSNETINNILIIFNDPVDFDKQNPFLGNISMIVLLLSFFLVSWIFEYYVFNFIQKNIYVKKDILKAMFAANLRSYFFCFVVPYLLLELCYHFFNCSDTGCHF